MMPFTIQPEHLDSLARALAPHLGRHVRPHIKAAVAETLDRASRGAGRDDEPADIQERIAGDGDGDVFFEDEDACDDEACGLSQSDTDRVMRHANENKCAYQTAARALGIEPSRKEKTMGEVSKHQYLKDIHNSCTCLDDIAERLAEPRHDAIRTAYRAELRDLARDGVVVDVEAEVNDLPDLDPELMVDEAVERLEKVRLNYQKTPSYRPGITRVYSPGARDPILDVTFRIPTGVKTVPSGPGGWSWPGPSV